MQSFPLHLCKQSATLASEMKSQRTTVTFRLSPDALAELDRKVQELSSLAEGAPVSRNSAMEVILKGLKGKSK